MSFVWRASQLSEKFDRQEGNRIQVKKSRLWGVLGSLFHVLTFLSFMLFVIYRFMYRSFELKDEKIVELTFLFPAKVITVSGHVFWSGRAFISCALNPSLYGVGYNFPFWASRLVFCVVVAHLKVNHRLTTTVNPNPASASGRYCNTLQRAQLQSHSFLVHASPLTMTKNHVKQELKFDQRFCIKKTLSPVSIKLGFTKKRY